MKSISAGLVSGIAASAVMLAAPLAAKADGHGHGGMDVPKITATALMEGLDLPWDMAVMSDGSLLCGKVLRVDADGNAHPDNDSPEGFDQRI